MNAIKGTALRFGEFFYSKRAREEEQEGGDVNIRAALLLAGQSEEVNLYAVWTMCSNCMNPDTLTYSKYGSGSKQIKKD